MKISFHSNHQMFKNGNKLQEPHISIEWPVPEYQIEMNKIIRMSCTCMNECPENSYDVHSQHFNQMSKKNSLSWMKLWLNSQSSKPNLIISTCQCVVASLVLVFHSIILLLLLFFFSSGNIYFCMMNDVEINAAFFGNFQNNRIKFMLNLVTICNSFGWQILFVPLASVVSLVISFIRLIQIRLVFFLLRFVRIDK